LFGRLVGDADAAAASAAGVDRAAAAVGPDGSPTAEGVAREKDAAAGTAAAVGVAVAVAAARRQEAVEDDAPGGDADRAAARSASPPPASVAPPPARAWLGRLRLGAVGVEGGRRAPLAAVAAAGAGAPDGGKAARPWPEAGRRGVLVLGVADAAGVALRIGVD